MIARPQRTEIRDSGILVPPLIFGTSSLGNLYEELDRPAKRQLVSAWFKEMGTPVCIDSAGKYGAGLALEEIGAGLTERGTAPDEVVISNKLGWKRVPLSGTEPMFEPGVWKNLRHDAVQTIGYDGILECWRQGNELLGPSYPARLLSVHDPDEYLAAAISASDRKRRMHDIREAYRALHQLKRSGRAAAVGVGAKQWTVIRELAGEIDLDWVMLADSLTIYTHPAELIRFTEELHKAGVFVINSALFNSGFLAGGTYFDYRAVNRTSHAELFSWRDRFFAVCSEFDVVPAHACVEFGLAPAAVSSISMNTTRPQRIAENVKTVSYHAPQRFWNRLLEDGLVRVTPEQLS